MSSIHNIPMMNHSSLPKSIRDTFPLSTGNCFGGREGSLFPTRKWTGVSGHGSSRPSLTKVSGLEFKVASTSFRMVISSSKLSKICPRTFLRQVFTDLMSRSLKPPQDLSAMIFQIMPFLEKHSSSCWSLMLFHSSFRGEEKVHALSN